MSTTLVSVGTNTTKQRRSALPILLGFTPVAVLALVLQWRLRCMAIDDAFIHLRIARNYALFGHAFFNAKERVMATSSPLWTILLTGFGLWRRPWVLSLIEGLLLTLCGALAYKLSERVCSNASRAKGELDLSQTAARSAAYHAFVSGCTMLVLVPSSIGLMETPLAIAFLLGAMLSILGERVWALPLLALAACTRLEVAPLLFVVFILAFVCKWPRRPLVLAAVVIASAAMWTFQQFGVLLPNSMHAKSIGYAFSRLEIAKEVFAIPFIEHWLGFCLSVFFVATSVQIIRLHRRRELPAVIWLAALSGVWGVTTMVEYIIRTNPIFEWYYPLIWVPILLCILLFPRIKPSNPWLTAVVELPRVAIVFLMLIVPFWKGFMLMRAGWQLAPSAMADVDRQDSARVRAYRVIGSILQRSCPGSTLMTPEIGMLGWTFQGHIDDAFGIASPRAMAFQPLRSGAETGGIPAAYAREIGPDMIVSYSALDSEVREDTTLSAQYNLIALPTTLPADYVASRPLGWHKSTHLDVLLRKNGTCNNDEVVQTLTAAFAPVGQRAATPLAQGSVSDMEQGKAFSSADVMPK